jgi:hypothetical protein
MKRILLFLAVLACLSTSKTYAQPCVGTPTGGTVASLFNATACPSSSQLIVLYAAGHSTGTGITWHWETSPAGVFVWTPIAGTTNMDTIFFYAYNQSGLAQYRVVVTCTNSGMQDLSNTIVAGPSPASACQDSVWPGDVNYDYIVDNVDALDLAIAMNYVGTTRAAASNAYTPQFSMDWFNSFANNVNYKNADCNGDSIVTLDDTLAIFNNYGLSHPKGSNIYAKVTGNPDLFFDLTGVQFIPGTTVSVPIKLGSSSVPMTNFYGLAAQVKVGGVTLTNVPSITYNASWLGTSANTLRFKKAVNANRVDWTYAKTDQMNASGNGTLATLTFTIPTNATGQATLSFDNVKIIDNAGTAITSVNIVNDTVNIIPTGISGTEIKGGRVAVVPNPSSSVANLTISIDQTQPFSIVVTNLVGQAMWSYSGLVNSGKQLISLPADMASGVYMIKVSNSGSSQSLKWIKN